MKKAMLRGLRYDCRVARCILHTKTELRIWVERVYLQSYSLRGALTPSQTLPTQPSFSILFPLNNHFAIIYSFSSFTRPLHS